MVGVGVGRRAEVEGLAATIGDDFRAGVDDFEIVGGVEAVGGVDG